jgi:polyisoprenyl-teichoic acid--peptidoglycan teichoic acid transferase
VKGLLKSLATRLASLRPRAGKPQPADDPAAPTPADAPAEGTGRSPSIAALLSFVWPGLGQLYAGNRRLFALFLIPSLVVVALIVYAMRQGPIAFGARFADPAFDLAALVVVILFGLWRLAAVVQAYVAGHRRKERRMVDRAVLAALAVVVIASHGFTGTVLATTYSAMSNVFDSSNDLMAGDLATPLPVQTPTPTPGTLQTPTPEPTAASDGRVTMLFTGVDSASTRDTRSYDSLMVVSYNPKANTVQMVSIPREIAAFPFYWGGRDKASDWITYLPNYLRSGHIKGSPDSNYITLVKEIQFLVGVHIDYWAVMNLQGFIKMVDAIGGIDINAQAVSDPTYDWLDTKHFGVYINAGQQHLNGAYALAYARSRHGGGNDYKRAARQQQVMLALLKKMSQPGMIFQLNNLIARVGSNVEVGSTDAANPFKPSMVADYIAAAEAVPANNFTNLVLGPPYTASIPHNLSGGKASICLNIPMVATQSIKMFGTDSLYYGKAKPADTCP